MYWLCSCTIKATAPKRVLRFESSVYGRFQTRAQTVVRLVGSQISNPDLQAVYVRYQRPRSRFTGCVAILDVKRCETKVPRRVCDIILYFTGLARSPKVALALNMKLGLSLSHNG